MKITIATRIKVFMRLKMKRRVLRKCCKDYYLQKETKNGFLWTHKRINPGRISKSIFEAYFTSLKVVSKNKNSTDVTYNMNYLYDKIQKKIKVYRVQYSACITCRLHNRKNKEV